MKKILSIILCLSLVAASIMAFPSVSAIASDAPTINQGFIPSDDSTWGNLYRYFDPEGFSALPLEVKQIYDSTLLNNNTASPTHETATSDQVSASTSITFLPKEEVEAQSRGSDLELADFQLFLVPTTNSI